MESFIYRHRKKIAVGVGLAILVILVVGIYNAVERSLSTATINITVSPLIAKVKIDGREYDATNMIKIRPGTYEAEVYADGFITKKIELVAVGDEVTDLSLYLDPTEENSDWYDEHVWDSTAKGDIISDNAIREFYALQEEYPILNYVPYNTFTYIIGYENECEENGGGLCLIIDADFGYRRYAIQYLQETGQDLSDYYAKGKNYKSPFQQIEFSVPDELSFSGVVSGTIMEPGRANEIVSVVDKYIKQSFSSEKYVEIGQIKNYDNKFFGVTLMVYDGADGVVYDIYRMVVGMFDNRCLILTNADMILSWRMNPRVPREVLRLVNSL